MQRISKEELLGLARLSRLELDENEIQSLMQQIEAVLSYAQRVQEIAQKGFLPEQSTKNINVMREDVIIPTDSKSILEQAPESEQNYFVVPVILEHN